MPAPIPQVFRVGPTVPPAERERMLDELAAEGSRDSYVRELSATLADLTRTRLGREPTAREFLQELLDALELLVEYKPDPEGEDDYFATARWTLGNGRGSPSSLTGQARGAGDCDKRAVVFAALARVHGFEARPRWRDQPGARLNHVDVVVCDAGVRVGFGGCVSVEVTVPGAYVGEDTLDVLDRLGPEYVARVLGG